MQIFGPYAAQVLAASCEHTIMDCLSHLDVQLDTLQEVLEPIMTVLTVRILLLWLIPL
jgi:hypothetical protein